MNLLRLIVWLCLALALIMPANAAQLSKMNLSKLSRKNSTYSYPINNTDPDGLNGGPVYGPQPRRIRVPLVRTFRPSAPGVLPPQVPEFVPAKQPTEAQWETYQKHLNYALNNRRWQGRKEYTSKPGYPLFEEHHAWPKFLGGAETEQDLVKLNPMYHLLITQRMNDELKGREFKDDAERLKFLKDFYSRYPLVEYNSRPPGPKWENGRTPDQWKLEPRRDPEEI